MGRIIDIRTENVSDLKTLFETLKDVLNETIITFYKSKDDEDSDIKLDNNIKNKTVKKSEKSKDKKLKKNSGKGSHSSESDDISDAGSDSDIKSSISSESDSEGGTDSKKGKKVGLKGKKTKSNGDKVINKKSKSSDESESDKSEGSSDKELGKKEGKGKGDNYSGIKIFNVDENQTLLIFVKLDAESFVKFNCKREEYKIGVELAPLFKQFKIMDKDGLLSMYVEENDSLYLHMDVRNEDNQCLTNHQVKLLDLNSREWKLPPSKFPIVVTMKCYDFHKICRDMHSINCEFIEITCTDKRITFSCEGDSTKVNKTYDNGGGVKIKCPKKKKDNIIIIKNIYELKYLTMFNKCSSICTEIQIFLKDEYPMFLRYEIATLGEMLVGLSPVVEKSVGKSKNYDPAMDVHYPKSEIKMKGDL